jgi:hypothetical protein
MKTSSSSLISKTALSQLSWPKASRTIAASLSRSDKHLGCELFA